MGFFGFGRKKKKRQEELAAEARAGVTEAAGGEGGLDQGGPGSAAESVGNAGAAGDTADAAAGIVGGSVAGAEASGVVGSTDDGFGGYMGSVGSAGDVFGGQTRSAGSGGDRFGRQTGSVGSAGDVFGRQTGSTDSAGDGSGRQPGSVGSAGDGFGKQTGSTDSAGDGSGGYMGTSGSADGGFGRYMESADGVGEDGGAAPVGSTGAFAERETGAMEPVGTLNHGVSGGDHFDSGAAGAFGNAGVGTGDSIGSGLSGAGGAAAGIAGNSAAGDAAAGIAGNSAAGGAAAGIAGNSAAGGAAAGIAGNSAAGGAAAGITGSSAAGGAAAGITGNHAAGGSGGGLPGMGEAAVGSAASGAADGMPDAGEDGATEVPKKKKGFFRRLVEGLAKTRDNIVSGMDSIFSGFSKIDDDFYDELEEILIMGDLGVRATEEILDKLRAKVKEQHIKEPQACREILIESIKEQMRVEETAYRFEEETSVVLIVGVNGVGKTTTVGKLAGKLKGQGKRVVIAGADTFRAAAGDQLREWANRSGVDMIGGTDGADPGSVVYDAAAAARARKADVLLVDTAGRLHNKKNLMNELGKINKILSREFPDAYRETLVVLDATTGQNALVQAKEFSEVADITGIVLTKMDGTAKGGIAVAIQSELSVPVKYIGVGEGIDDLQKFNSDDFVNALFDVKVEDAAV